MTVDAVRNVFCDEKSIGPSFGGGIWSAPLGKMEKLHVEDGQHVRKDVGDDHVGHEHAEGQRGQGQVEAAQPEGGKCDEPADNGGHDDTEHNAPQRDALRLAAARQAQVEHDDGGDGPERDGGQVDLPGVSGEERQREGDDAVDDPDREAAHVAIVHDRLETDHDDEQDHAPDGGRAQRRDGEAFAGAQQRRTAQAVLGQHDEDDEEDDHREGDAEVRGPRPVGREITEHIGAGQAEDESTGEGQPNAAQPPEHGGGDGIEHQAGSGRARRVCRR